MSDPFWSDVKFLSGFEGAPPVDESLLAQTVTLQGSATLSASSPIVGTKSLNLAVSGDCASIPDHADFSIGELDFTIEGQIRVASVASDCAIASHIDLSNFGSSSGDDGWMIKLYAGFGVWFEFLNTTFYFGVGSSWIPSIGVDHDLAVDFDGTTYRIYADGTMVGSETAASLGSVGLGIGNPATPLLIGAATVSGSPSDGVTGKADEWRFTVGTARYASGSGYTPAAFEREVDLDEEIVEGIGIFGGAGLGDIFNDTLSDGVNATAALTESARYPRTATDELGVTYGLAVVKAQPALATSGIGVSGVPIGLRGIVMLEHLTVAMSQITNSKLRLTLEDAAGISAALRTAIPATLTGGVGIALTQQAVLSLQIIEELGLGPTIAPMLKYGRTLSEAIGVADALARFLGGSVSETVGVASALVGNAYKPATLSQGIGIAPTQAHQLVIRVTASEEFGLDDVDVLKMLYSPDINEGIELTAAYLSPGSSITTWAMNTRTAAVTEYSNYAFNSFARLGDKYVGATSDGLYELLGDDDAGTDIIAQIKSGFAQWAGTKFTLFKAAYLGVRGEGDFVLRLISGEGQTYDYSVSTRDMRSTKVHMGKGLRARYFRFELISTGQDFDLESIEFVPLVAQRRV